MPPAYCVLDTHRVVAHTSDSAGEIGACRCDPTFSARPRTREQASYAIVPVCNEGRFGGRALVLLGSNLAPVPEPDLRSGSRVGQLEVYFLFRHGCLQQRSSWPKCTDAVVYCDRPAISLGLFSVG